MPERPPETRAGQKIAKNREHFYIGGGISARRGLAEGGPGAGSGRESIWEGVSEPSPPVNISFLVVLVKGEGSFLKCRSSKSERCFSRV